MVDQKVLNGSPVLARMTSQGFSENITKKIALPEDDEDGLGRVIEYLYGNNDETFKSLWEDSISIEKLATMYGLAEKYHLPDLKKKIVKIFKSSKFLNELPILFFKTAHQICQITSDSDTIFHEYFAEEVVKRLRKVLPMDEMERLSELIDSGGIFARKIVLPQAHVQAEAKLNWLKAMDKLKEEASIKEQRDLAETEQLTRDLEKAKRMHRSQHTTCYQCHVLLD